MDYTSAEVVRGDIERTVLATGTLASLNTAVVGSEVSGRVSELHADFNDTVTVGQLIARIDPRTFHARLEQARAAVVVAESSIAQAEADLARAAAERERAERELQRRVRLVAKGHVSDSELDAEQTTVAVAAAQYRIAEAAIVNARAVHAQQVALMNLARLDVERTYIRSPITGTVISRNVEIGQTVAASLQAPELFQIAQDLRRMKVEANINEMDIGQVATGMPSRFTVDAYPEKQFTGVVEQIRTAPETLFNVVTYKVIISVANDNQTLLPGMTANVVIVTGQSEDQLTVPNAALRFVPPSQTQITEVTMTVPGGLGGTVWQLRNDNLVPVPVKAGLSDERKTAIISGLEQGDMIVVRARPRST